MKLLVWIIFYCQCVWFVFTYVIFGALFGTVVCWVRARVTDLTPDICISRQQLLRALVMSMTLHAAIFTPYLAKAARSLMHYQLELFGLICLIDNGLYDGDTAFEVVIFISGQKHMQRLIISLIRIEDPRLRAFASN